jgi:hypothetical protein
MYNAWMESGTDGTPKNTICLKHPKMITIIFMLGSDQNAKEHKVFIMSDQGILGSKWILPHTYPDFVKKVLLY